LRTLGDGNVDAGANVLAVMAVTLTNLQRPDSAVVFSDGFETKLGCSLLVSGPLSASLGACPAAAQPGPPVRQRTPLGGG
jgi:hypothetical protein